MAKISEPKRIEFDDILPESRFNESAARLISYGLVTAMMITSRRRWW